MDLSGDVQRETLAFMVNKKRLLSNIPPRTSSGLSLPVELGYRMPAEWQTHRSTWLVWPGRHSAWKGSLMRSVKETYIEIICALLPNEKVNLLIKNVKAQKNILDKLNRKKAKVNNLYFHPIEPKDVWIRDHGPIFIVNQARPDATAFVKWRFNAWGNKYKLLTKDNEVANKIEALNSVRRFNPDFVLEGGSIDTNGEGICLTTRECNLNPNRNGEISPKIVERKLQDYLGLKKVLWLHGKLLGDDTDGHVDNICRFVNARTILAVSPENPDPRIRSLLKKNLTILKSAKDLSGRSFRIIELPAPNSAILNKLPKSYANFYIANKTVLVPIYSCQNDAMALKIIEDCFPGRHIIGIECTALVHGLGAIHCMTQQEPL
jgi:agmatine deiminase